MYFKTLRLQLIFVITTLVIIVSCGEKQPAANGREAQAKKETASAKEISAQIEKEPDNAELYYRRAVIYYQEKYLDRALDDASRAVSMDNKNPLYYYQLARIQYAMNTTAAAEKSYLAAIAVKPDYKEAQMKLAELYYLVKEYRKSIDLLNAIIASDPGNTDAFFIKGMGLKESGDTARAISAFQKAAETSDNNYDAAIQLGILLTEKKDKNAYEYLTSAIRMQPRNPEAYFTRAIYFQRQGLYQKALFDYRKVISYEPGNDMAYYNVAMINYEVKQYDEAIRSLNICIQINNENAGAYYLRGLAHEMKGNREEARLNYEKTLELSPGFPEAQQRIKKLK